MVPNPSLDTSTGTVHALSTDQKEKRLKQTRAVVLQMRMRADASAGKIDANEALALKQEGEAALSYLQADDLPESIRTGIASLFEACENARTSYRDISAALHAIDVLLYGQLGILFDNHDAASKEEEPLPPTPPRGVEVTAVMDQKEAALLVALTDKFYASWAFRLARAALISAFCLAFGGMVTIGVQSYSVVTNMREGARDADAAMKKAVTDTQSKSAETRRELTDLKSEIGATKDNIDQQLRQIREEVVRRGTDLVDGELRKSDSDLRKQIEIHKQTIVGGLEQARDRALPAIEADLRALSGAVKEMNERIAVARGTLTENERTVAGDQATLVTLAAPIAGLRNLAQQADALGLAVANIRADEQRAQTSAAATAGFNIAAGQDAAAAKRAAAEARTAALSLLKSAGMDFEAAARSLAQLQRNLDDARKQATDFGESLKHAVDSAATPPSVQAAPIETDKKSR